MVKLILFFLTVTLAVGSALASSEEYQRRSKIQVQPRGLDREEELFVRQPLMKMRFGLAVARRFEPRGFEDNDDVFGRDTWDDLEAREPSRARAAAGAARAAAGLAHKHGGHFMKGMEFGIGFLQNRALENEDGLFGRDLDAEELLERDRDFLDERDTFDDMD